MRVVTLTLSTAVPPIPCFTLSNLRCRCPFSAWLPPLRGARRSRGCPEPPDPAFTLLRSLFISLQTTSAVTKPPIRLACVLPLGPLVLGSPHSHRPHHSFLSFLSFSTCPLTCPTSTRAPSRSSISLVHHLSSSTFVPFRVLSLSSIGAMLGRFGSFGLGHCVVGGLGIGFGLVGGRGCLGFWFLPLPLGLGRWRW